MFENLKVGDYMTRVYDYHSRLTGNTETRYPAVVREITPDAIRCRVLTDVPRQIWFSRETGFNLDSEDRNDWLEYLKSGDRIIKTL
jgi:hypothetical protein